MINNLSTPKYKANKIPMVSIKAPKAPKRCIGRFPNLEKNQSVSKSKKPWVKRSAPNFVLPYLRGWCCTIFSPIFVNPALLANTGMYRCISPVTSMFFTTSFLYALSPQLKSFNWTPEVFLAAQLNILDGKFLNILESYLTFFQPDTKSNP